MAQIERIGKYQITAHNQGSKRAASAAGIFHRKRDSAPHKVFRRHISTANLLCA